MQDPRGTFKSDAFGEDIKKILPVVLPGKSDSSSMDMAVELLLGYRQIPTGSNDDDGSRGMGKTYCLWTMKKSIL
jgi:glutamate synthase domain-containing protein 1